MSNSNSDLVLKYMKVLKTAAKNSADNFLLIGEILSVINEKKLYVDCAEHIKTFDHFLAEVGLKRANAYHALRVWRKFGSYNVHDIAIDRLVRLLPLNLEANDIEMWLEDARILSSLGFQDLIRTARGKPTRDMCQHTETMTKVICKCCGHVVSVN